MWTLFLLHLVSFLWYQPAPCLQQLYPSFFSPALSHPLHYSSPPPPAPVPSVYPLRHYPPPLPSPPSSNLPMRYSRDQLLKIQPSTPNFELVNRLRELRLGVGLPRKRGCRGGRKKLRSIQVVPSRNLHPLMVPPFLQPHPDLQSAVGNAPLSSKHPTHLPTTDCLLSITPLMGGQPSDAPALSPPSPLQQGGQSSNAPALSPPSPLPQGSQPIALGHIRQHFETGSLSEESQVNINSLALIYITTTIPASTLRPARSLSEESRVNINSLALIYITTTIPASTLRPARSLSEESQINNPQ
ncbi:hypothetical protein ACOMHN_062613 [Nucella lapillus]